MSLTKTTVGVTNISDLSSTPNATEGLTAAQLQAKFDKTGADIKTYINDTLTEEQDTINTSLDTRLDTAEGIIANEQLFVTATAGSNGDFYCTLTNTTLTTNRIVNISFPAATTNTATARLSIGGTGGTYTNVKYLRGAATIPAYWIEGKNLKLYYDGTNWIIDGKIVAAYQFDSAGTSTGDIAVNSNLDGGIYEVSVFGASASSGELSMYINGVTTATDYYYQRIYISGANVTAETANRATAGYMYTSSSLNNLFVSLANGFAISSGLTSISTGNNVESLSYFYKYKTSITNITSIRFTMGVNFNTGARIIICKKC